MKAKLEFDLPEDREEYLKAVKGAQMASVLWDFLNHDIRDWLKYGHEFKSAGEALEGVRKRLLESLEDNNITNDDLL